VDAAMKHQSHDGTAIQRETARNHLHQGDLIQAERVFEQLLEQLPDDVEALQFLAARQLARRNTSRAIELLDAARRTQPDNPATLHQLGAAQMLRGELSAAAENLRRSLQLAPGMFVARLRLGVVLEQLGQAHEALVAYFGAINVAQAQGRWLSDATTAPGLRESVKHAIRHVDAGRRSLFDGAIEPLRRRYGRPALARVEQCLAGYLDEQPVVPPDPRQRPKFLYFPGVPSQPYYPRERFPWLEELEAHGAEIERELRAVLAQEQDLEAFLQVGSAQDAGTMLRASGTQAAAWDAYFFCRHGERYDAHAAACPRTSALLDALPLVRIRDHAPETLFSVLRPGTHILPHTGVTNTRLVTHLPLIVPPNCALRVGGELHQWREGRCVTFDDTFEHEAWNRSDETRVVLILDSWNPDLSEVERLAVTDLVEAIGDFNRACEVPVSPP
jgi:aspartate beta-hydroxylase